ncbi:MarR family transcriptional regulator [Oryzifoliimicrobium ureilyticus]|uniref:MarR family transcriptional regulator n=1 Tax=Oryzifoliimicrobium ureilyticus TaxID=3113724 RepID=UPI0030762639
MEGFPGLYEGVANFANIEVWKRARSLLNDPRLRTVILAYCRDMSIPSPISWPSHKIFGQKFRYLTSFILIGNYVRWLDHAERLPTLTALQESVPASPRQVADLIKDLRLGGYVQAIPSRHDRRATLLAPTPALLLEVAQSPLACLAAAEALGQAHPGTGAKLRAEPHLLARWIGESVKDYLIADTLFMPFPTIVSFSERDAGYMILTAVMGSHHADLSPEEAWELNLKREPLARRFHVSPQHIGNIFNEAKADGLFEVRRSKVAKMNADLRTEFNTFVLGQIIHYALVAGRINDMCPMSDDRLTSFSC